jgi:hypothetical protein
MSIQIRKQGNQSITIKLKCFFIKSANKTDNQTIMPTTKTTTLTRTAIFQKSTRKNQEFERFLCGGQEAAILDATTSKYIPLSYFAGGSAPPRRELRSIGDEGGSAGGSAPPRRFQDDDVKGYALAPESNVVPVVGGRNPRRTHSLADKMPYESFRLINLQQRGSHAHSLILFKSRAITTNPEQISIFECNGQYTQSEIRVIHTSPPPRRDDDTDTDSDDDDEQPGTVYDVTEQYFSPISPKVCINYGNDKHNPGYCGIFGIIAMVFHRKWAAKSPSTWIKEWTALLKYMRQEIPDEPACHGCMGINLAAKVQEIIAAHPSTAAGHKQAEKAINALLYEALKKK